MHIDNGAGTRRSKIIYTVCIYSSFLMIGWSRGLLGPSFPDIQRISQVDLELGSWIVTTFYIGNSLGCLTAGLLDTFNSKLVFGWSLFTLLIAIAAIPWCSIFGIMIVAHLVQGFSQGIVDTIGNSEILLLWKDNRLLYFCLELCYNVGSFAAPLVMAPFLMDIPATKINVTSAVLQPKPYNRSWSITDTLNVTSTIAPVTPTFKSKIYIPYSFTAIFIGCISVSFLLVYVAFKEDKREDNYQDNFTTEDEKKPIELTNGAQKIEDKSSERNLPKRVKIVSLAIISVFLLFYDGVEETFGSFLTMYCVNYLNWTPSEGALITSITNICGLVAVVVSLFMKCVNTMVYAGVNCVLMFLTCLGMLFSSLYYNDMGMWISCCIYGFFRSMLFSLTLTWTNEYITPVTGRIASVFMVSTCIGASVNPVMLGNIMERLGDIWLCYGFAVEGFILLLFYFVIVGITRYVVKNFGKNIDILLTEENTIAIS